MASCCRRWRWFTGGGCSKPPLPLPCVQRGPKTSFCQELLTSSVDGTLNSRVELGEKGRKKGERVGRRNATQRNATQRNHCMLLQWTLSLQPRPFTTDDRENVVVFFLALMCSLFLERLHAVSVTRTVQPAGNNEVTYISSPLLAQESLAHDSRFLRAFSCYFFINLVAPVSPFLRQPNLISSR